MIRRTWRKKMDLARGSISSWRVNYGRSTSAKCSLTDLRAATEAASLNPIVAPRVTHASFHVKSEPDSAFT